MGKSGKFLAQKKDQKIRSAGVVALGIDQSQSRTDGSATEERTEERIGDRDGKEGKEIQKHAGKQSAHKRAQDESEAEGAQAQEKQGKIEQQNVAAHRYFRKKPVQNGGNAGDASQNDARRLDEHIVARRKENGSKGYDQELFKLNVFFLHVRSIPQNPLEISSKMCIMKRLPGEGGEPWQKDRAGKSLL